ncbi:down syndrome cell adhesion molecule-like protein Dscam2 [Trichonephila clavipes]|nr:down syndrome cell adhesion molecule-like protein Dscam2 [Trichonephila clavipes]
MTGQRYIDEVLLPHVRLFRGAVGDKFVFMDDNATCHRTLAVQDCLSIAGRNYPPTNKNTLIRALTEEWDKLPQQLLDNVVQSMLLVYADKPQTLDHLEDNIRRVIADKLPHMLEKVIKNWTSRLDYIRASRGTPQAPDKTALLAINSTFVVVRLSSWNDGGCPILYFEIRYKPKLQKEWILQSSNIAPAQATVTLSDLNPGTWYDLLMAAHNDADSTEAEYVFATLTASGAASVKLTYSASMVDRLTDFCLKVRDEIGVSSIKAMNPPIDTQSSLFVAKSESE